MRSSHYYNLSLKEQSSTSLGYNLQTIFLTNHDVKMIAQCGIIITKTTSYHDYASLFIHISSLKKTSIAAESGDCFIYHVYVCVQKCKSQKF